MPFSIIIPTWNNLPFLKCCITAIRRHSAAAHEIVLHINDGSDGTLEWATTEGVAFTHSLENIGICKAVNLAFSKTTQQHIVYLNDDMYVLPGWDKHLFNEIEHTETPLFMFSATMIEPRYSGSDVVIHGNFGESLDDFQEEKLLAEYKNFEKEDWYGASFPPLVISREAWLLVGGFSIEFSPGMYSDPDLSMKLWMAGCRIFKGVGQSRVYHFMARSTGRVKKNNGRMQFMKKWGLSAGAFYKYYLKFGTPYNGKLAEPTEGVRLMLQRLKGRFYTIFY